MACHTSGGYLEGGLNYLIGETRLRQFMILIRSWQDSAKSFLRSHKSWTRLYENLQDSLQDLAIMLLKSY